MALITISGNFTKEYFDNGKAHGLSSYDAYLSGGYKSERILPKATAIVKAAQLASGDRVLDFGCAAGYFVYCYRKDFGLNAQGTNVSSDALDASPIEIRDHLSLRQDVDITSYATKKFDLVVAKDVLEHIPTGELDAVISELRRIGKKIIVSVPLTSRDGEGFIDSIDEQDPSHVIRLTRASWMRRLGENATPLEEVCLALKGKDRLKSNLTVIIVP